MQDNYEGQIKELREKNQVLEEETDRKEKGIEMLKKINCQLKGELEIAKKELIKKNNGVNDIEEFLVIDS
jgi:FtsZ-binding cell division protein ZapB